MGPQGTLVCLKGRDLGYCYDIVMDERYRGPAERKKVKRQRRVPDRLPPLFLILYVVSIHIPVHIRDSPAHSHRRVSSGSLERLEKKPSTPTLTFESPVSSCKDPDLVAQGARTEVTIDETSTDQDTFNMHR